MRVTQGTFSFLPDFTKDEIKAQVQYAIDNGWALAVEYTDDPHPRNSYWEMWELPMFEIKDASAVAMEIDKCIESFPNHYVKVVCYDPSPHRQTTGLDFIVNRPEDEPGFTLERSEANDRHINYTMRPYAADKPHGDRYRAKSNGSK